MVGLRQSAPSFATCDKDDGHLFLDGEANVWKLSHGRIGGKECYAIQDLVYDGAG